MFPVPFLGDRRALWTEDGWNVARMRGGFPILFRFKSRVVDLVVLAGWVGIGIGGCVDGLMVGIWCGRERRVVWCGVLIWVVCVTPEYICSTR